MKKILLFIALFLGMGLSLQAQTYPMNVSSGTISVGCSSGTNNVVYTNSVNVTWNVDILQEKRVKIEYNINTEASYDKVTVYSIDASGAAIQLFSKSGRQTGISYSDFPTGKIRVVFITDGSVSCGPSYPYTGFDISFSADDKHAYSPKGLIIGDSNHQYIFSSSWAPNDPPMVFIAPRDVVASAWDWSKQIIIKNDGSLLTSAGNFGVGVSNTNLPENSESWNRVAEIRGSTDSKFIVTTNSITSGLWSHNSGFYGAPAGGFTGTASNHPFSFVTNKVNRMTILANGNVGINTANAPVQNIYKLTVNGDIQVGLYRGDQNVPTGYANKIDFGAFENTDPIWIARYNSGPDASELRVNLGDGLDNKDRFVIGITRWDTGQWNESFSVLGSGDAEVAGTLRAKDIKVCLTQGCDFVFAEDYPLMKLNDLSDFIKTNRHLPEVAPAAQMEADGINLSEMQAKLLQKIEELTLYVIQQDKAIENLQKKNEELESRINNR